MPSLVSVPSLHSYRKWDLPLKYLIILFILPIGLPAISLLLPRWKGNHIKRWLVWSSGWFKKYRWVHQPVLALTTSTRVDGRFLSTLCRAWVFIYPLSLWFILCSPVSTRGPRVPSMHTSLFFFCIPAGTSYIRPAMVSSFLSPSKVLALVHFVISFRYIHVVFFWHSPTSPIRRKSCVCLPTTFSKAEKTYPSFQAKLRRSSSGSASCKGF